MPTFVDLATGTCLCRQRGGISTRRRRRSRCPSSGSRRRWRSRAAAPTSTAPSTRWWMRPMRPSCSAISSWTASGSSATSRNSRGSKAWAEALAERPSTHSFPPAEFEAMYRDIGQAPQQVDLAIRRRLRRPRRSSRRPELSPPQAIRVLTLPTPSTTPSSRSPRLTAADPFGRAGEDEIAGGEADQAGEIGDGLRHAPDHPVEIGALARLAVDLELDAAACRMADARGGHDLADGGGEIEALAHVPGPAGLLGLRLEIAPGHVEPGGIAIDMAERLARLDIGAAAPDGRHQLHLVMEIGGLGRIGHAGAARSARRRPAW